MFPSMWVMLSTADLIKTFFTQILPSQSCSRMDGFVWKVSGSIVFSGTYFLAFEQNTEHYSLNLLNKPRKNNPHIKNVVTY